MKLLSRLGISPHKLMMPPKNLPGVSDTYDIVKDYSGIVGVDALTLADSNF